MGAWGSAGTGTSRQHTGGCTTITQTVAASAAHPHSPPPPRSVQSDGPLSTTSTCAKSKASSFQPERRDARIRTRDAATVPLSYTSPFVKEKLHLKCFLGGARVERSQMKTGTGQVPTSVSDPDPGPGDKKNSEIKPVPFRTWRLSCKSKIKDFSKIKKHCFLL